MMFRSTAIAALLMIHGSYAACDDTRAKELISHMDQFNVMLGSFASLGSSVMAASSTKHVAAHATGHNKREVSSHSHPTSSAHNAAHTHINAAPTTSGAVHTESPEMKLHKQIQSNYHDLSKKQKQLDSYTDACVPIQHKIHLASQMTNMMNIYVTKDKQIKAAGQHVVEKKKSSKSKRSPEEKAIRREERLQRRRELVRRSIAREKHAAEPAQAAWLTMDDSINGGFNGQQDQLTSSAASTTSTADVTTSMPYYQPYQYNSPQLEPQYVTITSSGSVQVTAHAIPSVSAKGKAKAVTSAAAGTDDDSGSDSGSSDDDSGSSDDETSSSAAPNNAPLPTPSSTHHNLLYELVDVPLHLVTGTLHFVENIFSKIFIVENISQNGSKQIASDKQLNQLLDHAKQLYNVKN